MRQTAYGVLGVFVCAAFLAFGATSVHAAFVTGPWNNADPPGSQGDGPIHNANTASPIVGDLIDDPTTSSNAAEGEMIDSPFPEVTLANSGDKIVFTGSVTLSGTVNSAASSGTPRTQFRFGLFDGDETGPDDFGWVGYLMTNAHGTGTPAGSITRKNVGNTNVYLSTTGAGNATSLVSTTGNGSVFNDDTFALSMTIQRSGSDLLLSGSIVGASSVNNFSQSLSTTDVSAATLGTYTFDHLGFLLGGNLDTDRAAFSNLDVTFMPIPEPSSIAMILGGIVGLMNTRRRAPAVVPLNP